MAGDPDTRFEPDQPERDDAIARAEQRVVNAQGGDYAEGTIDKRQGTFVEGIRSRWSPRSRHISLLASKTPISVSAPSPMTIGQASPAVRCWCVRASTSMREPHH